MIAVLVQVGLVSFGLTAMWLALGTNARLRRWAPVIGLVGQCFWFAFAWQAHKSGVDVAGLVALCCAYTAVYARGVWIHWSPR